MTGPLSLFAFVFLISGNSHQFAERSFSTWPNFKFNDLFVYSKRYFKHNWGYFLIELIGGGFIWGVLGSSSPRLSRKTILSIVIFSTAAFLFLILLFPAIQKLILVERQHYLLWYTFSAVVLFLSYEWGKHHRTKIKYASVYIISILWVAYFHCSSFWFFVFSTDLIKEYRQVIESMEENYFKKKISPVPIPTFVVQTFCYPHLDQMKENQNFVSCIGRYYGIQDLVIKDSKFQITK